MLATLTAFTVITLFDPPERKKPPTGSFLGTWLQRMAEGKAMGSYPE
jgi:hypothetical protein